VGDGGGRAERKVVEQHHLASALGQQPVCDVAADQAGPAGDDETAAGNLHG
jgi:hypothetical protein